MGNYYPDSVFLFRTTNLDFSPLHDQIQVTEQLCGELDETKEQMGFLMLDVQDLVYGQELLKEENTQLKARLSLVMRTLGIVLKKEDGFIPATIGATIPPYNLGTLLSQGVSPPQSCTQGSCHL